MKVLVIQQKMIGDVLTSTIICENLKIHLKDVEVHYLVHTHTIPVIKENPSIDTIIDFKDEYRESKRKFFQFIKELNTRDYDVLIDIYGKLETNIITLNINAKYKITYYKWYTQFIYNYPVKRKKEITQGLSKTIINRLQLLKPLGINICTKKMVTHPKIYLTDKEVTYGMTFLKEHNINLEKPIFMISVLGSDKSKSYPSHYMAKLIDYIAETVDCTLLFNYIPKQIDSVNEIYSLCNNVSKNKIRKEVFAPSLRNFLCILNQCNAIIGNEGGAINMAKALDIPSFAIFSPWIEKAEWSTEDNSKHVSVHLSDFKPELFQVKKYKSLKTNVKELCLKLKPDYIINNLSDFLKNENITHNNNC